MKMGGDVDSTQTQFAKSWGLGEGPSLGLMEDEAASYAEDLRLALEALSAPEKLQINTLTDLVRENSQYAAQSVEAIKQRIRTVCLFKLLRFL